MPMWILAANPTATIFFFTAASLPLRCFRMFNCQLYHTGP